MSHTDKRNAEAYFEVGKQNLLLRDPNASFSAYIKAIELSTAPLMVEESLESLLSLKESNSQLPGYQWMVDLHHLGLVSKFKSKPAKQEVLRRANADMKKEGASYVILVGGSSDDVQELMEGYKAMLLEAFEAYHGTIISGGSVTGISKLAGDLKAAYPDRIRTIGYLPASKMSYADRDPERYSEIRTTDGETFSPLELTQYWMDIIASGIKPEAVKLIAINGGKISTAECKLAATLGAEVGIVQGSGGEPVKLFSDSEWNKSSSIFQLANDASIIRSFISKNSV